MVASAAASAEASAEDGAPPPLAAAVRIEHARLESKHPKQQTAAAQLAQMEQAGVDEGRTTILHCQLSSLYTGILHITRTG